VRNVFARTSDTVKSLLLPFSRSLRRLAASWKTPATDGSPNSKPRTPSSANALPNSNANSRRSSSDAKSTRPKSRRDRARPPTAAGPSTASTPAPSDPTRRPMPSSSSTRSIRNTAPTAAEVTWNPRANTTTTSWRTFPNPGSNGTATDGTSRSVTRVTRPRKVAAISNCPARTSGRERGCWPRTAARTWAFRWARPAT